MVNYDIKHSAFLKPEIGVLEFYALSKRISLPSDISQLKDQSLNANQRSEFNSLLHGILLKATYGNRNQIQRFVKVCDKPARSAKFKKDGVDMTVEEYFKNVYKITLKCPNLPLVQIGNLKKGIYVPMELLKIADKRQRVMQKLPDDLQALTTSFTTVFFNSVKFLF
jgi:hypothetical protein